MFFVKETPKARPSWRKLLIEMDIGGMLLIVGAVVCFNLAMQWGGISKAWNSPPAVGTLVGFGLIMITFVLVEWYQGETAMVHSRIIKRQTMAVGCLFSFL